MGSMTTWLAKRKAALAIAEGSPHLKKRKEEGGRRKEGGRRAEGGGRRKEEGGRRNMD